MCGSFFFRPLHRISAVMTHAGEQRCIGQLEIPQETIGRQSASVSAYRLTRHTRVPRHQARTVGSMPGYVCDFLSDTADPLYYGFRPVSDCISLPDEHVGRSDKF